MKQFKKFIGLTLEEAELELMELAEQYGYTVTCVSSHDGFFNIDVDPKRLNVDIDPDGLIIGITRG